MHVCTCALVEVDDYCLHLTAIIVVVVVLFLLLLSDYVTMSGSHGDDYCYHHIHIYTRVHIYNGIYILCFVVGCI